MVLTTKTRMKSLLVFSILLSVIPLGAWNPTNTLTLANSDTLVSPQVNAAVSSAGAPFSTPGPDLGITNWTHNHFENPGLEDWANPRSPNDWYHYRSADRYQWFATEPPYNVSEGTYSAGQQTRTTVSTVGWSYWYQSGFGADMQNLTLDFDWLVSSMPDQNFDYFLVYVSTSDNRYVYYYIAGANGVGFTNTSTSGTYRFLGPIGIWQNFYRNITADYLAIPGFPSTISPGLTIRNIYFYCQTGTALNQWLRAFFDDVELQNASTTYIGGTTRNGNLETASLNPWYTSGNGAEAHVLQSSIAHSGSFSGNVTGVSDGNASLAQLYQYPRIRITNDNHGSFSFWWHLNQPQVTSGDYAMINFQFYNFSNYFRLYYVIGAGGALLFSNSTWDHYYLIDDFNTTGSWKYFQCDLWQEMSSVFGNSDAIVDSLFVTVLANNPGSHVEVLIDDAKLVARTVTVADFEDQRNPGSLVYGWDNEYSSNLFVTDQGYGGGKAANCSLNPLAGLQIDQDLHRRPLNSTRETYLDLMWRIEDFSEGYITFYLQFDDSRVLWYILATSTWGGLTNTSSNGYFNVTGSRTIGSWMQLHRDLVHDYEAAFGSLPDTEMSTLEFEALAGNSPIEVLFDDVYIYDDPAPILDNVVLTPGTPVYDQAVVVDLDVIEQDLDMLELGYRIDLGTWTFVSMAHHTGNTYRATIPAQPYDTRVDYFFRANDTWGMYSELPGGPATFTFIVADLSGPEVSIDHPPPGAELTGIVNIDVTATDEASGMDRVEFSVDGSMVSSDSSTPYSYAWDSTTVADGSVTITATAYDNDGNTATDSITLTVSNGGTLPPPPPIPGFPITAVALGLFCSLGIIIFIRRQKRIRY